MHNPDPDTTIFVVDDDRADRESLTALLGAYGFRVRAYPLASAFLEEFVPPRRGCLLVDVRMPKMGGLELQQRLVAESIHLPVIVMTAYGDVPTAVQAMKFGAVDFIEKPFRDDVVLSAIGSALDQEQKSMELSDQAASAAERMTRLTPREREVLNRLVIGRQNKEVAFELGISPRTVEIHRSRVMDKMEAKNLSQLIRMVLATGWDGLHI